MQSSGFSSHSIQMGVWGCFPNQCPSCVSKIFFFFSWVRVRTKADPKRLAFFRQPAEQYFCFPISSLSHIGHLVMSQFLSLSLSHLLCHTWYQVTTDITDACEVTHTSYIILYLMVELTGPRLPGVGWLFLSVGIAFSRLSVAHNGCCAT